ncbi:MULTISPECIES: hypothetical protein [unclassified Coleofasciculus]|uniref:hypothetical protein n=1 Tax=unclassified Coleofasciculus TaxID=2692782 RepID=UPI00188189C6|nr:MULTISPECIES: hypothetical protein [unclassified Coleofasciculus]MBE9125290.1 hypothetical protein [Coleofasciculus sp. LEGE 07081]MBE9147071.1 hypothetical protein [Coleofasciculus sp. LEGE 07092]
MLEVTILSLLTGNLGWQALVASTWLRWRQIITSHQYREEEEETLTCFEPKEESALAQSLQNNRKMERSTPPEQASTDPQLIGWEFKIVRSSRDMFHKPDVFQRLCEEEAIAGWILLEKIDDRRVRFKRLIALRNVIDPQQLPIDPYRCHYGSSWTPLTLFGGIAALLAIAVPSYLSYTLISTMIAHSQEHTSEFPYEEIPPQDFPPTQSRQ